MSTAKPESPDAVLSRSDLGELGYERRAARRSGPFYNRETLLQQAKTRALPVLNRVPDLTPAAQACCGVCRTCTTTNVLTLAGATLVGGAVYGARLARRITARS